MQGDAMHFEGQLFGAGLPASGEFTSFSVDAFGLNFKGAAATVSWSAIRWRRGGFNDSQVFLEWSDATGAFSLVLSNQQAQQTVLQYLSPNQKVAPATARGTRGWVFGLISVLLGLPLLTLVLIVWQSDRITGWAVERIPVEMEEKIGEMAFAQFRATHTFVADHSALRMLKEVGARITKGSSYTYQFHVVRDATINAFAMPGGYVVFHTGLLEKADRAEEVAGVLAHEIQHVERRHSLRAMVHAAGLRVMFSLLLGDASGSAVASLAENLGNLRFSRAQESDADLRGTKALVDAHIDPRGLVDFFKKLAKDSTNVPSILSSHPASEERFAEVEKVIPQEKRFPVLDYDISSIRGI